MADEALERFQQYMDEQARIIRERLAAVRAGTGVTDQNLQQGHDGAPEAKPPPAEPGLTYSHADVEEGVRRWVEKGGLRRLLERGAGDVTDEADLPRRLEHQRSEPRAGTGSGLLDDLLLQLDALTGLASVKTEVMKLIALVRVSQMRRVKGLPVTQVSRHLVFTGNPGTGKTTVARLLGRLYAAIGSLPTGQLVEVTRSDLVAGYVGQTAIKTTEAVNRAVGGILFIDEAYALTRDVASGVDFGLEAVDTLVKLMEDHRDELVVIVAGYSEEMTQFINANPGLPSRFSQTIHFPDYSTDELITIFEGMCDHDQYQVSNPVVDDLRQYLETLPRTREFGNARLVRNLFEGAIGRQASRIVASGSSDLITFTSADLGTPQVSDEPQQAGSSNGSAC